MKRTTRREEETTLIRKTRQGDLEAFERLIDEYGERIYALAFQFLGNHADAEDMVQEAFIRAYRNLDTFRGDSTFSTWLFRITLNLCSNYRKKKRRVLLLPPRALTILHHQRAGSSCTNPHRLIEIREAARTALENLSLPLRKALLLVAVRALSHREAAEIEGCSEGTISWRVFQARQYLQESLADYFEGR